MERHPFQGKTSCCFTGHRPDGLPDGGDARLPGGILLRKKLLYAVYEAVAGGVTDFYAGGASGFDLMAADAVLFLAGTNPALRLHLALPFRAFGDRFQPSDRKRLERQMLCAESVWYAAERGAPPYAFHARDRYMVEHADCVIAYLAKPTGGTRYTVDYALRRGLYVRNLASAPPRPAPRKALAAKKRGFIRTAGNIHASGRHTRDASFGI